MTMLYTSVTPPFITIESRLRMRHGRLYVNDMHHAGNCDNIV